MAKKRSDILGHWRITNMEVWELTILLDFLIYHHRQRERTLVQKYLASLPPSDGDGEFSVLDVQGYGVALVHQRGGAMTGCGAARPSWWTRR